MYQIIRNKGVPSLPNSFLKFTKLNKYRKIQTCNELFINGGGHRQHRHYTLTRARTQVVCSYMEINLGRMDMHPFKQWLINHFIHHTNAARPLLLLLDGHSSHYNLEAVTFAKENHYAYSCSTYNS